MIGSGETLAALGALVDKSRAATNASFDRLYDLSRQIHRDFGPSSSGKQRGEDRFVPEEDWDEPTIHVGEAPTPSQGAVRAARFTGEDDEDDDITETWLR